MIRVLIVEDSPSAAQLLHFILSSDPGIRVVGVATDGEDALRKLDRLPVDVVTMDIQLPGMNGFETTRRIMETKPVPIVIVSSLVGSQADASNPFRVMEEGALALLGKPPGPGHAEHETRARDLIRTVRMISEVKVFRRRAAISRSRDGSEFPAAAPLRTALPGAEPRPSPGRVLGGSRYQAVVIGASTGGPTVIGAIFALLGTGFPIPVLVVQHITSGYAERFADWIEKASGFPTKVARHGEQVAAGTAYIAPDDAHMGISANGSIVLDPHQPPIRGIRPSASYLFESAAVALGDRAIGVILSGMGADGSKELGLIRQRGGVTMAQEAGSCIVPGMPAEAERLGSVDFVLSPESIARKLLSLAGA